MPPEERCSICGRESDELYTCFRCRRLVCNSCVGERGYCRDCELILKAVRKNLEIELNYVRWCMERMAETVEQRSECVRCWCLRELSISLLKTIRGVKSSSLKNGFEDLEREAEKLEKALTQVCAVLILAGRGTSPGKAA